MPTNTKDVPALCSVFVGSLVLSTTLVGCCASRDAKSRRLAAAMPTSLAAILECALGTSAFNGIVERFWVKHNATTETDGAAVYGHMVAYAGASGEEIVGASLGDVDPTLWAL